MAGTVNLKTLRRSLCELGIASLSKEAIMTKASTVHGQLTRDSEELSEPPAVHTYRLPCTLPSSSAP